MRAGCKAHAAALNGGAGRVHLEQSCSRKRKRRWKMMVRPSGMRRKLNEGERVHTRHVSEP
jgi:hypothetical protein